MVGSPVGTNHPEQVVRQGARGRFLIALVVTAGLLVIAAVALVILERQPPRSLPAGSPAAVVQGFLQAVEARDYPRAFQFLTPTVDTSDGPQLRSYQAFRDQFTETPGGGSTTVQVTLEGETIEGDAARVAVVFSWYGSSGLPFASSPVYTSRQTFTLRQWAGQWRIVSFPYEIHRLR